MNQENLASASITSPPFPALVTTVARQWRRALDIALQPLGLTEATWRALIHTARGTAPMHQKDLARAMGLDNSSVVRLVVALERDGHIIRIEDTVDKRAKQLILTEKGRELSLRVETIAREVRTRLLGNIPETELAIAMNVLNQISAMLSASQAESMADRHP